MTTTQWGNSYSMGSCSGGKWRHCSHKQVSIEFRRRFLVCKRVRGGVGKGGERAYMRAGAGVY